MVTITPMPKPLTFEEWITQNPYLATLQIECRNCNGTGQDECFNCGHSIECETCDGSGTVEGARILYEEQIDEDKRLWQKALVTHDN